MRSEAYTAAYLTSAVDYNDEAFCCVYLGIHRAIGGRTAGFKARATRDGGWCEEIDTSARARHNKAQQRVRAYFCFSLH
jgi:hypothetical protein